MRVKLFNRNTKKTRIIEGVTKLTYQSLVCIGVSSKLEDFTAKFSKSAWILEEVTEDE